MFRSKRPSTAQRLLANNLLKRYKKKVPTHILMEQIKKAKIRRKKRLIENKRFGESMQENHDDDSLDFDGKVKEEYESDTEHSEQSDMEESRHDNHDEDSEESRHSEEDSRGSEADSEYNNTQIKEECPSESEHSEEQEDVKPDRSWAVDSPNKKLQVRIQISSAIESLLKGQQSINIRQHPEFENLVKPVNSKVKKEGPPTSSYASHSNPQKTSRKTAVKSAGELESSCHTPLLESLIGGMTLSLYCSFREIKKVEFLLSQGADPNQPDSGQLYPLMSAIKAGSFRCTQALIEAGATVNFHDINGWTPLHLAASVFSENIINLLLSVGAILDAKDDFGNTPIFIAAQYGRIKSLRTLVRAAEERGLDMVNVPSDEGMTPLLIACQENHKACINLLLAHGGDANIPTSDEVLPIHLAVQTSGPETVALLLKYTNIEELYKNYESPLFLAIEWKRYEVLEKLIRFGLPLNQACISYYDYYTPTINVPIVYGRFMTPLVRAVISKDFDATKMLLGAGCSPCPATKDEFPAIIPAADKGGLPFVELLMEFGLDINWKSSDKVTCPDILYFSLHNPDLIEMLVKSGLDIRHCFDCECNQGIETKVTLCRILPLYKTHFNVGNSIEKILTFAGSVNICAKALECLANQSNWDTLSALIVYGNILKEKP